MVLALEFSDSIKTTQVLFHQVISFFFNGTFFSWAGCAFSSRFFCKEQFNVTRLSSKDVGSPMVAGPSASVMKKIASVLLPLN